MWSQHLACKAAALQRYVEDEGPGSSRDDLEPAWLWGKIMGEMGEKTCSWGYGCSFFPQISMYNIYIFIQMLVYHRFLSITDVFFSICFWFFNQEYVGIETRLRMTDKDWDRTNNILLGTSHEAPGYGDWWNLLLFHLGFAIWMTGQSEVIIKSKWTTVNHRKMVV